MRYGAFFRKCVTAVWVKDTLANHTLFQIIKRIGVDLSKTNLSYIESLTTHQRTITNSDTEPHQFHKMTTKN